MIGNLSGGTEPDHGSEKLLEILNHLTDTEAVYQAVLLLFPLLAEKTRMIKTRMIKTRMIKTPDSTESIIGPMDHFVNKAFALTIGVFGQANVAPTR